MKIQLEPGSSSTDTHSLARSSSSHSSRLVNLHLHETDLAVANASSKADSQSSSDHGASGPDDSSRAEPIALSVNFNKPIIEECPADKPVAATPILSLSAESSATADAARDKAIDTKALAMNIAADYTAANLASMSNLPSRALALPSAPNSQPDIDNAATPVGRIAEAVSDAIASIRTSSDPDDIAAQMSSLKTFSDLIRHITDYPELAELSDTIDKFLTIAEKSTGVKANHAAVKVSRAAKQTSRAATKVAANKTSAHKVPRSAIKTAATSRAAKAGTQTARRSARTSGRANSVRSAKNSPRAPRAVRGSAATHSTANSTALRQALASVATMEEEDLREYRRKARRGSIRRGLIAFASAAACIAVIIWFVATNIPDISVRVAAMQTGVNASYPSYIPTEYSLSHIDTEEGKITLDFTSSNGTKFTMIEAKSSWDSAALERNYAQPTWGSEYTVTHEQGITIFINGSSAAWVNGGVLFKITADANSLTKKQLRNIVTSM